MDATVLDAILDYIEAYQDTHNGLSPTVRELAAGCYMSNALVMRGLDYLHAQGKLTRQEGKARSIRLVGREKTRQG
jgi:DeoR/GlpR family transcriptional regulator of sugar metabolism